MTSFDDRAKAMESRYAHDQKLGFEVEARGSKLFGLWVAEKLSLAGADAETYARSMVEANLDEPGFDDILRKARIDLDAKHVEISDHLLNVEIQSAMKEAQRQLTQEEEQKQA